MLVLERPANDELSGDLRAVVAEARASTRR